MSRFKFGYYKINELSLGRNENPTMSYMKGWIPKSHAGRLVKKGTIRSLDELLSSGLPIQEPELVDIVTGGKVLKQQLKPFHWERVCRGLKRLWRSQISTKRDL